MPYSLSGVYPDGSCQVLWEDGERVFCRGWRLGDDANRSAVLVVLPAAEHPSPSSLDRLAHEYGLKDELDGAWAVQPLELVRDGGRTMLVLEDPGGEPLERLLGEPMEMGRFLSLAIGMVTALGKVHQHGLFHKDIKPANVLVIGTSGEVRLTGFGIASHLPRERQAPEPPEIIAGTLSYMAPEQTGRMNRATDFRSDFYALGITLYQLLTGALPFTAADPMEWVHCHIARRPVPPAERRKEVPGAVSAIIMKLLAKSAEERYQTAAGLESDLRRCLAQWQTERRIDNFSLGEHDTPARLLIPEKLYGRAREIETLLAAFDRVVRSRTPELVLVSGYSGIGKSSVVHELHNVLVPPRGLFASGKFDQQKRDIPYATLAQAFQSLVRGLLAKSEADLRPWRGALSEALGPNGHLMVDLVPELELIIGQQPPVPPLEPQQAQARFQLVFRRFIGVFARPEHPLALFLDDLQWLDATTLDLLEDLVTRSDLQHLMLIGAYRDNEVDAAHPLARKLEAVKNAGGKVKEITLAPLAREHLEQLIADALRCEPARAAPLAQLVHDKTGGNPFFVIQFLHALAEEGLLTFEYNQARWCWDLNRIHAKGYTDNVVDLMVGKLNRLPPETQAALQQLACLGNTAEITMLSIVLGTSEAALHSNLWEAVRQELVERLEGAYRFFHDRVQEAAYSLIPEARRAEARLRIGRLLMARTPPEKREEAIFEIVGQLNRGAALITSRDERDQLAELNLIAGQRARASTSYAAALTYLVAGAALLPNDPWERCYKLTFQLEFTRAECEFLNGELAAAEARLTDLARRAARLIDLAAVTRLQVELLTALARSDHAVQAALNYLRRAGIAWSAHPTDAQVREEYQAMWKQLGDRPIELLLDLPRMTDPVACATMGVLAVVIPPAKHIDHNLYCVAVVRMVNLSLAHGNSDASCLAYLWPGVHFGDYKTAFRFAKLAVDLVEKGGFDQFKARVYLMFAAHQIPWAQHVQTGRELLRHAFEGAIQAGDLTFALFSRNHFIVHLLACGDPLDEVQRAAEAALNFVRQTKFGLMTYSITTQLQLVRTLRGQTPAFTSFNDTDFDESTFEQRLQGDPRLATYACWYWIRKLQARFLAGDYGSAIIAATSAEQLLSRTVGFFEWVEYHFYAALTDAVLCDAAPTSERTRHREALAAHHRQLQEWTEACPENFENRAALVGAEIARLDGRDLDAMRLYEQAIRSARDNGFVHNQAIAYERASVFYHARGLDQFAETYLRNARHSYLRWRADGKVRQLDQLYPQIAEAQPVAGRTTTIAAPLEHLDLTTLIKVSQAVSGEIVLKKLLDTIMRTAIEQAGAERGVLVLSHRAEPRIAAEARTDEAIIVQLRDEPVTAAMLPESILHYVLRTRESVILDDAAAQSTFAADSYIRQCQLRSVLCLPLLNQAKLIGVLYLENRLAPRVFGSAQIAVLRFLASQAAISLENTSLYRDLRASEARFRTFVDFAADAFFLQSEDGTVLDVNPRACEILGYGREELIGMTPFDFDPDVDELTRRRINEGLDAGEIVTFETRHRRKDGTVFPVEIRIRRLLDRGRTFKLSLARDISERKRVEEHLRVQHTVAQILAEGATIEEATPRILRAMGECLGWDVGTLWRVDREAKALRCVELWHKASIEVPEFERVSREFTFVPGLGLPGRVWSSLEPKYIPDVVPDENFPRASIAEREGLHAAFGFPILLGGEVLGVIEFFSREIRQPDQELLNMLATIGSQIGQFIERKRAEEALREAQAELDRVARLTTIGELTASIAHEINQPLGAVVNDATACVRWLAAQNLEEARQSAAMVIEAGHRAAEIIGRIRALAQKAPPEKSWLDLNDTIRDVIALARSELQGHRVLVRAELRGDLPPILADRIQLQQVLLNLMMNAIEAMNGVGEGQRELVVRSARDESKSVLVAVQDSGPGPDQKSLERLFDAFYTTKAHGLGLGLAISRRIIEAHGGRLWATANAPRGAIFQFTLPVGEARVP